MRVIELDIKDIEYTQVEISDVLYESVKRIGLSFPIKVNVLDEGYICIDGNKRLTALERLGKSKVLAIVLNNGNNRSNDCWRGRNHH